MSANNKPRADSKLKTLPEERQAAIYEYATTGHSLEQTVAWLREDGVVTSRTAMSEFVSWYSLQQQLKQNESTIMQVLEDLRKNQPTLTEQELQTAGQMFFSALAIEQQDSLTWKRTQDAKTRAEIVKQNQFKLQRESIKLFIEWSKDQKSREILEQPITNAEKIEQLGQRHFGKLWDLKTD